MPFLVVGHFDRFPSNFAQTSLASIGKIQCWPTEYIGIYLTYGGSFPQIFLDNVSFHPPHPPLRPKDPYGNYRPTYDFPAHLVLHLLKVVCFG